MNIIHYITGETKYLHLKVYCRETPLKPILVSQAAWELHRLEGQVIDSGSCTIESGNHLSCLLRVDKAGEYCLKVTYQIGPETYITTGRVYCDDCH